ncbi:DUF1533 domain-containing protein [Paraglaciecola sp. 20A4]|uniref:DUF1533 domain-containing protein n=1 Tax=Paraglaciecola sp. 20A4 TaxID=2687288 RepID=UPI0014075B9B|nr:DUF1533 domain-containing protein [Paraglaciecola sp. 20A4]
MWSHKAIQSNGLGWVKIFIVPVLLGCIFSVIRQAHGADTSDIVLSERFVDGMTLPAYKMLEVSGQAPNGRTLDVKLVKNNVTVTMARVTVNSDGNWNISLNEQPPSGPYQLKISDDDRSKVINDIYIGQDDYKGRNPKGGIILTTRLRDDMLLQPGEAIDVSGLAEPGRSIDIKLIKEQVTFTMARVHAGRDGQWRVTMPAQNAGGPFQLEVTDGTHNEKVNGIIIGRADIKKAPVVTKEIVEKKPSSNNIAKTDRKLKPVAAIIDKPKSVPSQIKSEFLQQQFDDSSWPLVNLTSLEKLPKNEPLVVRKHVHFAIDPQVVSLSVGQANQIKQIYINGQMLEATDWQQNPIKIAVPNGMFRSGDNVIALISKDQWDNTRFIGTTGRFNLNIDNFNLELSSNWSVFFSPEKTL